MTDYELLQEYAGGSQEAFALLVRRHMDWVYTVAKRRVREAQMAEDVAQAAFILLARIGPRLRPATVLPAWLLKVVGYLSQNALRAERRRKIHELAAAGSAPMNETRSAMESEWMIDECVGKLPRKDKQALLLRFYQSLSLREIGAAMGTTEEAARKRVTRALDQLKTKLEAKNFAPAVAAPMLAAKLGEHWIESSPAHLAQQAARLALRGLNGTERAAQLAQGVNRMFALSKAKMAAVMAIVVLLPSIALIGWMGTWVRGQPGRPSINSDIAGSAPQATDYIQSEMVMIVLSPDQHRAWAFSVGSGGPWLKFPTPDGPTQPLLVTTVSNNVGIVQSGTRVCGFSGVNGRMDYFDLPAGSKASPTVGKGWAYVRDGSRYWAFSAEMGKWEKVDTLQ